MCRLATVPRHPPRFVSDLDELQECLHQAKLQQCPHCKRSGTLIGHGFLRGYAEHSSESVIRGRRLFCSDRFLGRGCGRTVAVLLDSVLRAFTVRTSALFELAAAVVTGRSIRGAWACIVRAFSLSSGYRLWHRLLRAQSAWRTRLLTLCPPPVSQATEPMAQLLEHFRKAFTPCTCPFSSFQSKLQTRLLP